MDNQPVQENQTPVSEPSVIPSAPTFTPISSMNEMDGHTNKKKRHITLIIVSLLILILGGGTAYALLVYFPNKPENVFKKAIESFVKSPGSYTATVRIDQDDTNLLDYGYSAKTSANGDSFVEVTTTSTMQAPGVSFQKVNGKLYVNFSNFQDKAALAKRYINNGEKGLQEYIAEFTDKSNITPNMNKWLSIDDYFLQQPEAANVPTSQPTISGVILSSVGGNETINGKLTKKYEATLSADAFTQIVSLVDKSSGVPILSNISPASGVNVDSVKVDIWINTKTKSIEQASYSGRPFKEATFSLKLIAANHTFHALASTPLTNVLGYGIVSSQIFSKNIQSGNNDNDRERIADLKGIKTALEIFKSKVGHYPERYEMSVQQDSLLSGKMAGVDKNVFKDPNGRYIGLNGSQYAYVPTDDKGDQSCGKFAQPCTKYFINTTLDNGKQFQLNSN